MSDDNLDLDAEKHAYSVTKRLFFITLMGTVVFSGIVAVFFL